MDVVDSSIYEVRKLASKLVHSLLRSLSLRRSLLEALIDSSIDNVGRLLCSSSCIGAVSTGITSVLRRVSGYNRAGISRMQINTDGWLSVEPIILDVMDYAGCNEASNAIEVHEWVLTDAAPDLCR